MCSTATADNRNAVLQPVFSPSLCQCYACRSPFRLYGAAEYRSTRLAVFGLNLPGCGRLAEPLLAPFRHTRERLPQSNRTSHPPFQGIPRNGEAEKLYFGERAGLSL